jgi:hypothetical protein
MTDLTTSGGVSSPDQNGPPPSLLRALLHRKAYVMVVLVLLLAAAGLNGIVQSLSLYFRKQPVPMRKTFVDAMPAQLGDWVQVVREETLNPDIQAALGTEQFLFCHYVNARALGMTADQVRELFKDKSLTEQKDQLNKLREGDPKNSLAVLQLALTYYTGKADTVAHIPERCYVGDGYDPDNPSTEDWDGRSVRYNRFDPQKGGLPCHVAYFFHVNGRYESNPFAVRAALQDLFQRYGYYAKIELMCAAPKEKTVEAKESMRDCLKFALPHVEQALPDWEQYRSRR